MAITKTQKEVLDRAKETIDFARTHTLREWAIKNFGYGGTEEAIEAVAKWRDENWVDNAGDVIRNDLQATIEYYKNNPERYENEKNAIITWTINNSATLKALENKGLIEIIVNGGARFDAYKVLNY